MSRSAFSRVRVHVPRRCALSALAASVALVVVGASAAQAAQPTDTFSGSCSGQEGLAWWPQQPLTWVPVVMPVLIRFSGGECSGTVNGRDVQAVPARIRISLYGEQSCAAGTTSGRFELELAGRTISGAMTYGRVGPRVQVLWQGDGGGSATLVGHAQLGLVRQDDPAAATPVVGPLISGPMTHEEAVLRCSGEGLSQMPVAIDDITTVPSLSG
jgi:hypothetical protein